MHLCMHLSLVGVLTCACVLYVNARRTALHLFPPRHPDHNRPPARTHRCPTRCMCVRAPLTCCTVDRRRRPRTSAAAVEHHTCTHSRRTTTAPHTHTHATTASAQGTERPHTARAHHRPPPATARHAPHTTPRHATPHHPPCEYACVRERVHRSSLSVCKCVCVQLCMQLSLCGLVVCAFV